MEIKVISARPEQMKKKPTDESKLGFGDIVTDHMFLMNYEKGKGWINARIEPYHTLAIDPAAMAIHYGQEIFEGLKAYRGKDGGIYLFRARENFIRINRSAVRLCMPEVDIDFTMEAMKKLILLDQEWVPEARAPPFTSGPPCWPPNPTWACVRPTPISSSSSSARWGPTTRRD